MSYRLSTEPISSAPRYRRLYSWEMPREDRVNTNAICCALTAPLLGLMIVANTDRIMIIAQTTVQCPHRSASRVIMRWSVRQWLYRSLSQSEYRARSMQTATMLNPVCECSPPPRSSSYHLPTTARWAYHTDSHRQQKHNSIINDTSHSKIKLLKTTSQMYFRLIDHIEINSFISHFSISRTWFLDQWHLKNHYSSVYLAEIRDLRGVNSNSKILSYFYNITLEFYFLLLSSEEISCFYGTLYVFVQGFDLVGWKH